MGRLLQHRPAASGVGGRDAGGEVRPARPGADTVDSSAGLDARAGGGRGGGAGRREPVPPASSGRDGDGWVSRKVGRNGIVCVSWQQVIGGQTPGRSRCDVLVSDQLLQFWIGAELMKTVPAPAVGR